MNSETSETGSSVDPTSDVESRLLQDERRRDGAFLRDYLSRHGASMADGSEESATPPS